MANFQTHLAVSGGVSALGCATYYGAGIIGGPEALLCVALGLLGGFFADIDSDSGPVTNVLFSVFSAILAFAIMFSVINQTGIVLGVVLGALVFASCRFGVLHFISQVTEHRGMVHSIPMALLSGFTLVIVFNKSFNLSAAISWLYGLFFLVNYFIHLLLDEFIKVNLSGGAMEQKFGSALCLVSFKQIMPYIALYIIMVGMFLFTPSFTAFIDQYASGSTVAAIIQHIWP